MSEGREVLGYTLIRREPDGREMYKITTTRWSTKAADAQVYGSTSELLASIGNPALFGGTLHIGRVVRIPGEQTVEQILEPEAECMWGCRVVFEAYAPWRGPRESTSRNPIPMTLADAEWVRGMTNARYIVPLRVTKSEPRTVVEEVECE